MLGIPERTGFYDHSDRCSGRKSSLALLVCHTRDNIKDGDSDAVWSQSMVRRSHGFLLFTYWNSWELLAAGKIWLSPGFPTHEEVWAIERQHMVGLHGSTMLKPHLSQSIWVESLAPSCANRICSCHRQALLLSVPNPVILESERSSLVRRSRFGYPRVPKKEKDILYPLSRSTGEDGLLNNSLQ